MHHHIYTAAYAQTYLKSSGCHNNDNICGVVYTLHQCSSSSSVGYKLSMSESFLVVTVIPPSLPFEPGSSLSL